ncbi:hypothetical protein R3I94_020746 [Phoxinus phoxinus]
MSLAEQSQQWYPTSVQVTVLQARGLRIKGKNGTNDAYAIMQVAKDKFSTSVAEKSVAPVWKEEAAFDLPLFHPGNAERCTLQVCVMHRALMGPDKTLGQATVNLLELQDNKSRNKPDWFKLMDKTGKADKDRGEVLLDIQFMRNNMTASTYDLSGQDKSRSRLGKLKDKLKGKKKDGMSDSASAIVPSFGQVLTDSEGEEEPDVTPGAKKKNKLKSLFAPKSGLQRNMSQSMSTLATLPEKDSPISLSRSSGLNVESPEGKKKFKFLKHKRTESSDSKVSQGTGSLGTGMVQGNVCINGSHVYTKAQENRAGSTFSLNSSGHGSMEDLRRGHDQKTSVDSLKNSDLQTQGNSVEEMHRKQEEQRKREAEVRERLEEERRQAEKEEMKLIEREQGKKRLEEEERKRLEREEEKRKLEKQVEERKRIEREEERKRIEREEERKRIEREEEKRKLEKQEEERKRIEREEERKRIEIEERKRMVKEEEKRKLEKQEEERKKIERARENEQKRMEEEEKRKLEKKEVERRIEKEETERKRIEQEEMIRIKKDQERIRQEEEKRGVEERIKEEKRKRMEEEENARKEEDKRRKMEEEERTRLENEKLRKKGEAGKIELERRAEEERRRKENEKVEAEEKRKREEERRMTDEKAKEQERLRLEKEKVEFEKKKIEERMREEQVRKMAEEEKRKLKEKADQERIRQEKEEMERQRQEKEQRPEVKPRSARLNKSKKAPDEMNSDFTPSSNPFEDLLSVDESSTNPFEQATVPQPEALSRSTKVSAVKPRPHAVKPLSTTDNHPDLRETQDNSRSATITADMQVKMKAPVAKATGPYSQLTNEELMNLLEKQKVQLSQKDSKIGELEQYIDNLLVRVMEENPAILMSLTSMKKSV